MLSFTQKLCDSYFSYHTIKQVKMLYNNNFLTHQSRKELGLICGSYTETSAQHLMRTATTHCLF